MNQLVTTTETAMQAFEEFERNLAEFKEEYAGKTYDLMDLTQNKHARADLLAIGKLKSKLDKKHAELKAPLKEQVDRIDGVRKTIKDQFIQWQQGIKDQLTAHEEKIAVRKSILQGYVDAMAIEEWFAECATTERTLLQIASMIVWIDEIEVDETYEERQEDATEAKQATLERLSAMRLTAEKREADAAELGRLQKDREEREEKERLEAIRREEEEKAKRDADAAAQKKIDDAEEAARVALREAKEAEERAEQERLDAEFRAREAKIDAERIAKEREERAAKDERERIEAEQREQEEREKERLAKEEKLKAKASHQKKIRNEAKAGLTNAGYCDADASGIIEIISEGAIPHVSITY